MIKEQTSNIVMHTDIFIFTKHNSQKLSVSITRFKTRTHIYPDTTTSDPDYITARLIPNK